MAIRGELSPVWDDFDRSAPKASIILGARNTNTFTRHLGQLFMMGFDGTSVNSQVRSLIEDYHVGSVLLSAKNLKCAFNTEGHFWKLAY
jgi:hypothetical protein